MGVIFQSNILSNNKFEEFHSNKPIVNWNNSSPCLSVLERGVIPFSVNPQSKGMLFFIFECNFNTPVISKLFNVGFFVNPSQINASPKSLI